MRHKQVDGCSLFSALASAVSLNFCLTLSAPHCLEHSDLPACAHSCTHTHAALEKLVTQASPHYRDVYACAYSHTSLTVSGRRRHLLKGVFDGSRMSHYAHTHTHITQQESTQERAYVRTNKQTRLEDNKKAPGFKS